MNSFIDLELSTTTNSDSQIIRMSPSALAEIIETQQRMNLKDKKNLFGALMGTVSTQGTFLVSSVVCLNYSAAKEPGSDIEVSISKGWKEHIANHEQLYSEKCLSTFMVNPDPKLAMVTGLLTTAMSGYKRSKLDAQVEDLLVNVYIDPENGYDYQLQAFKIVKSKYFSKSFATMHRMRIEIDYIPQPAEHDFHSLFFFQMQKHNVQNSETQLLESVIEKVAPKAEETAGGEGDFEFEEDAPMLMTENVLQKFEEVFACRRRWDQTDLDQVRSEISEDVEASQKIRKALQLQIKVARKIAIDNLKAK